MIERRVRQFFGRSAQHERACVEITFPAGEGVYQLARLEPLLGKLGLKLGQDLPDEPLPLEEAVRRLAGAMLFRRLAWWSKHGRRDDRAFAAISYPFPKYATLALDVALDLVVADGTLPDATVAKGRQLSRLLARDRKVRMPLFRAAELLGRDFASITFDSRLTQVGQGSKGLHFYRAVNERDSLTGYWLEGNKQSSVEALARLGLPTTRGVLVTSPDDAAAAVKAVGLPCVVKPVELGQGRGVAPGLQTVAQVANAIEQCRKLSDKPVRVENHVAGDDHRLLVVGDELMWAYRKAPAGVVGDGKSTVSELIADENRRRSAIRDGAEAYLLPIPTDAEFRRFLAARYGFSPDAILPRGKRIAVSDLPNTVRGGRVEDVSGIVHPDNRALAIRASRLFRIRTMGIDFITPDISRSWKDVPSAIIEVNRSPLVAGIGEAAVMHRALFPNRRSGCIPMIAIIGDNDYRARATEPIRAALSEQGFRVVSAEYAAPGDIDRPLTQMALPPSIETMLLDPEADAGLLLCDPDAVEKFGLPLSRHDLIAVQDGARFPWLDNGTETIVQGDIEPETIERAIGEIASIYRDPAEGGPLPALEPLEAGTDAFGVRVWRVRTMPRAWFWGEVGVEAPNPAGLATHLDLLAAVRAHADCALREVGVPPLPEFAHPGLDASWTWAYFDAALALPEGHADAARAALLAAVERVNQVAAMKIP